MIICICKNITERQIKEAAETCCDIEEIQASTDACTCCEKCRECIQRILDKGQP